MLIPDCKLLRTQNAVQVESKALVQLSQSVKSMIFSFLSSESLSTISNQLMNNTLLVTADLNFKSSDEK